MRPSKSSSGIPALNGKYVRIFSRSLDCLPGRSRPAGL